MLSGGQQSVLVPAGSERPQHTHQSASLSSFPVYIGLLKIAKLLAEILMLLLSSFVKVFPENLEIIVNVFFF